MSFIFVNVRNIGEIAILNNTILTDINERLQIVHKDVAKFEQLRKDLFTKMDYSEELIKEVNFNVLNAKKEDYIKKVQENTPKTSYKKKEKKVE